MGRLRPAFSCSFHPLADNDEPLTRLAPDNQAPLHSSTPDQYSIPALNSSKHEAAC
ncbi:MAG: hypothetical protein GY914_03985 [Prochlorococcus sp.]|nr:hypothetical protein [Prochlorococcus sp.]